MTDLIDPELDGEIRPEEIRSVIVSFKEGQKPRFGQLSGRDFQINKRASFAVFSPSI